MKLSKTSLRLAMAASLLLGAVPAFAAATAAGTTVSNTASINFSVGGVAQTAQTSNTATFLVDRSINLTVVQQDASLVTVVPGQTAAVTTFVVTNNSNSVEDFRLAAVNSANGTVALTGTDNFDTTGLSVFVESSVVANGYQAGTDVATFIDELAPGASKTVYVVANIPAGQVNNDVGVVALTAIAAQSTNGSGQYVGTPGTLASDAAQTNTGVADVSNFVDTVFADAAGATDAAKDGKSSALDGYKVVTASIAVIKSSTVISDPVNGTTNPKALPGAVIEYCLVVNNTGSASATGIVLSDAIPSNTTYSASTIKVNATGTSSTCNAGTGTAVVDTGDANGDFNVTTAGSVTVKDATLAAAGTFRAVFRVTVN